MTSGVWLLLAAVTFLLSGLGVIGRSLWIIGLFWIAAAGINLALGLARNRYQKREPR
jgi:hypothetical protein